MMGTIFSKLNGDIEARYSDAASDSPSEKIYADYVNSGQPSSGQRKPLKSFLRRLVRLLERHVDGNRRRVTAAGAITVDASTDDLICVAKTVEEATVVNFPTVAARLAAEAGSIVVKNEMSNGALYPLTITPPSPVTVEGQATFVMDGTRQSVRFYPDDTVTPNNWEIR